MNDKLLNRNEFRKQVFQRDNHKCVICGADGKDAHHIMERRLFDDGGYYLNNGSTLCEEHHLAAEMTTLSCEEIREACGITKIILPEHLYNDNKYKYDKWGDIILPNGNRLVGELFFDESAQKILKRGNVLQYFTHYIKYPRTYHLPWSQQGRTDDKYLKDTSIFKGKEIVVTTKMDGESTTFYNDYIHARSINSGSHPSRKYVKGIWGKINWEIPDKWRICGENLYARHTIEYNDLEDYFLVFSIWNEKNECLDWEETKEYCDMLQLKTVSVIYEGLYNEEYLKNLKVEGEGYVIRLKDSFKYKDFRKSVAKCVNDDFVLPHGHWFSKKIIPNKLK